MANIGIALIVMIMAINCFTLTYRLNGINRTLLDTPISLFEVAVPTVQEQDEIVMYFDRDQLVENLTYYYDSKLVDFVDDYTINYYFSNVGSDAVCTTDYCDAVEVNISANVVFSVRYNKTMRFEIRSTQNG